MKTASLIAIFVLGCGSCLRADDKPSPVERTLTEEPAKTSERRIAELERRVKALEERLERLTKEPVVAESRPRTNPTSTNDDRERWMSLSEDGKAKFRKVMTESREKMMEMPTEARRAFVKELFDKISAEEQAASKPKEP